MEAPTGGPQHGNRRLTDGPGSRFYSELKTPPNKNSSKQIARSLKNPGKFLEEEGVIVNNFCNYNFLRFSTDF
jgi:hypothetical protein